MDDFNISREDKIPQYKLAIAQYVVLAIFLVLCYGLWRLQVLGSDKYEEKAERNRVREIPILAPRGRIFDRNGRLIVDNYPSFSVLLLRDQKRDLNADIPQIASGLNMSADDLRMRIRKATQNGSPSSQPIILKDDIPPSDLAFVEAHRVELPELETIMVHRRLYPKNGFAAHLIGYVGEVSEDMLNTPQYELYEPGMIVGKSGVEKFYNNMLMGKDGSRRVEVDSRGREIRRLSDTPAIPGKPLRLTLDLDLQIAAEQALGDRNGAIVVLDPHNGDVLAMVSRPVFDPNKFAVRISGTEWSKLIKDPGKPLLNKAIQAQLAPGSVFKIIMSVAGLQEGIAQTLHVNCPGGATFYGRYFKCWVTFEHRVHGPVDISKAIYQSCDVFFYTLAERLGIGKIAEYATRFGLGKKTGIDLYDEASGVMPSEEWKIKNFKQKWYPGETISVGIGQGAITVTPIQLTRAISAVSTDGVLVRPHVAMFDALPPEFKEAALKQVNEVRLTIDRKNWETITNAMAEVPTPEGTAGASHIQDVDFAGKTGSAQVVSLSTRAKFEHKTEFAQNSWFVGFTPRRNPDIVVGVLFEGGEHGKLAARMAAMVIRSYVERERNRALELKRAAAPGTNPTLGPDRWTPPKQAVKKPEPSAVAEKQTASVDFTGVWNEAPGNGSASEKLQAGRFRVRVNPAAAKAPAKAAPGISP